MCVSLFPYGVLCEQKNASNDDDRVSRRVNLGVAVLVVSAVVAAMCVAEMHVDAAHAASTSRSDVQGAF